MAEPNSTAALLELIERECWLRDNLLAELGEERMLQPGATGDWSFKGHSTRRTCWLRSALECHIQHSLIPN